MLYSGMESMYLKIKNPEKNPKDKNLPNEIKFKTTSKVTRFDFSFVIILTQGDFPKMYRKIISVYKLTIVSSM